jgi:hypothetical protein
MGSWTTRVLAGSLCGVFAVVPLPAGSDPVARRVVESVQQARVDHGGPPLERRPELDALAAERARLIARLPHRERLHYDRPPGEQLRAAGIEWFSRAAVHLDMVRGYVQPEIGFLRSWRNYETAWNQVVVGEYTAVGAATARDEDGWVIFVALFLVDLPFRQPSELEGAVIDEVNRVRSERGLDALVPDPVLAEVARGHSEDMVRREFVGHVNPDGLGAAERADLAGIRFAKLGENVHMNRGADDPVSFAVGRWLESDGHRETMLDPEFSTTGVGAAMAGDGRIFLTQLFAAPAPPR